ncbi:MAG: hypothetical protein AB1Z57_10650 [Acidimicrobiia bacterium]
MSKVNLLPQERSERNKARRGWVGGAFAAIAYLALLGAVFMWFKGGETAAQADLDAQLATNQQLQAEIQSLAPYAELGQAYDDGVARVEAALANDVAWGRLLGDFGRMISDKRVWMESLTVAVGPPSEQTPTIYGSVAMAGQGFDYPDVSSWLLTLDSQDWDAVTGSWAGTVTQADDETQLVTWDLTTSITDLALSDRSETRVPDLDAEVEE